MAIVINGSGEISGISVGGLPDGIVDSGTLADDAVGLAQMAAGTDGNIITYDASGNPAVVATGSSGEVLTSAGAGAAPTMSANNTPIFRAYLNVDQSHGGGNQTITFDTQDYIVGSGVTFGSYKFTITTAGKYLINYGFRISSSVSNGGLIAPKLKQNSTEIALNEVRVGAAGTVAMGGSAIMNISADDEVYLVVYTDACTIKNGAATTFLEGFRIG